MCTTEMLLMNVKKNMWINNLNLYGSILLRHTFVNVKLEFNYILVVLSMFNYSISY